MSINRPYFFFTVFIIFALFLLKFKVNANSKQSQAVLKFMNNHRTICHDNSMSVYLSKLEFSYLPFSIYIKDEYGKYYQAVSIAKQCYYFFRETDTFIILTVSFHGCFVKTKKYLRSLHTVIMAPADKDKVEIIKSIHLICEKKMQGEDLHTFSPTSVQFFCNKDGFSILLTENATVPRLNLDAVRIPFSESQNCKPQKLSADTVIFNFTFTECGTQSMMEDGIITYWINIEGKQNPQKATIFRDTPLFLTVSCSFKLTQETQLDVKVNRENSVSPSTLLSEGALRTEMRFAKDSSYKSYYSSLDLPPVRELGQPVYVEVFLLKHENKDLMLRLEDCWATPTTNPYDPQRWNLLIKGCPAPDDSQQTVLLPVVKDGRLTYPSLHKWFMVKLFSFVKTAEATSMVYFHCKIEICSQKDCSQSCIEGRRMSRRMPPNPDVTLHHGIVSGGPVVYLLKT